MHKYKKLLLLSVAVWANSLSASTQTGKIVSIHVREDGLHWFYVSGRRTTKPACATNSESYWMIKNENSTAGKSQLSVLLSAHMAGKEVVIQGSDTCIRWADGEDISTVILR